jgi:hypothetical protein
MTYTKPNNVKSIAYRVWRRFQQRIKLKNTIPRKNPFTPQIRCTLIIPIVLDSQECQRISTLIMLTKS